MSPYALIPFCYVVLRWCRELTWCWGNRLEAGLSMRAVFQGKQRLEPSRRDLCYYSWTTQTLTCHSSPNFKVGSALPHQQPHLHVMGHLAGSMHDMCEGLLCVAARA